CAGGCGCYSDPRVVVLRGDACGGSFEAVGAVVCGSVVQEVVLIGFDLKKAVSCLDAAFLCAFVGCVLCWVCSWLDERPRLWPLAPFRVALRAALVCPKQAGRSRTRATRSDSAHFFPACLVRARHSPKSPAARAVGVFVGIRLKIV